MFDFISAVPKWIDQDIYPYFPVIESATDRTVYVEGIGRTIMYASCDYLGLSNDDRIKKAAIAAIEQFGTNVCGSIIFSGYTTIHRKLTRELEAFFNTGEALLFPTSYLANLGVLSTLYGTDDVIICDRQNHVSLFQGASLSGAKVAIYRHNDMNMLEKQLRKHAKAAKRLIVVDGLFSADGDYVDLPSVVSLAERYNAQIMLDSAHDFGLVGENGRGVAEHFGLLDRIDILIGTMSKALGSTGGFVICNSTMATQLRHASGPFHSSRTISPGVAAASLKALEVLREEGKERRQRVHELSNHFIAGARANQYDVLNTISPIIPVMLGSTDLTLQATSYLRSRNVLVSAFIPPATPSNKARLRFGITYNHTPQDIDHTTQLLSAMSESLNISAIR